MAIPLAVLDLGMGQVLLIMFVVLLLFGAKKSPELAKGLGEGLREFKKATRELHNDVTPTVASDRAPTTPKPTPSAPAEPPQKPSPPAA